MSETVVSLSAARRLSAEDYAAERNRLWMVYGASRDEAGNRFEQELAKLFTRSGWTQEELARVEEKPQAWISRQQRA